MRDWKFNNVDFSVYPYYPGDDLGLVYTKTETRIRIWAPFAEQVELRIYKQSYGGSAIRIDYFEKSEHGTWLIILKGDLNYHYYAIKVFDKGWLNENPGIDAKATGINGNRALIFDPEETNPEDWGSDNRVSLINPVDAIIYELHIRDFSIFNDSGIINKGKFIAFTEKGTHTTEGTSTGIDHLIELGITHVHLLPVNDFYTVDEQNPDKKYNWGYDPQNFNTPEGSYSTNPDDISRIKELKMLVKALHDAGIGVILDLVYNHTALTRRSNFNQTVPGYYYRQKSNGAFSNASGCGNEIASERAMVRKYIVDSIVYWANEFHIDGFRFDLMGIFDVETMNRIRTSLDLISPSILLYGEGWAADKSPMAEAYRAVKTNVTKLNRIAVFNDDFRDGIKGNNFNSRSRGFVSGLTIQEENIKFGIVAACYHHQIVYDYVERSKTPWANEPWQCINYASSHDNYTLYDKLRLSSPEASENEIARMAMLSGALVLTSQGIPFLHAGVEMLRTKGGDYNSYKSGDKVNKIDWSLKSANNHVFSYFQWLIKLRKEHPSFRMNSSDQIRKHLVFTSDYTPGVASYYLINNPNGDIWKNLLLVFNANRHEITFRIEENKEWIIVAHDTIIAFDNYKKYKGNEINVPPISFLLLAEE